MNFATLGCLLAIATAISCNQPPATTAASEPPKAGVVALALGATTDSLAFPAILEAAFLPGTTAKQATDTYTFTTVELGKLGVPTGKLLAADPIMMSAGAAFTQQFPIGEFPVQLALAHAGNNTGVGYARIVFSPDRVARWQLALLPGQKPLALKDSSFYCYPVDSGMGVFVDSLANQRFETGSANWNDTFIKKTSPIDYTGYIHRFAGYSLATFRTGAGDGCYPTYIGFDAKGRVCRLLTDFGFVAW